MKSVGVIFRRTVYDSRWSIIGWGLGLGLYMLYVLLFYPSMKDMQSLNEMLEMPIFQALVGSEITDFTSPPGFLGIYVFMYIPLILAVFAILYGLGITAVEEDRGTLDVLLALPVPRWQLIVEKFAAAILILVLILLLMFAGAVLGLFLTPSFEIDLGMLILAHLNVLPITLLLIGLTLLLSTLLRSRGLAAGVVTVVIVASYFMKTLGDMASEPLSNLRNLSIYQYYNGATIFTQGVNWANVLLLSGIAIALLLISLYTFQHRDLST